DDSADEGDRRDLELPDEERQGRRVDVRPRLLGPIQQRPDGAWPIAPAVGRQQVDLGLMEQAPRRQVLLQRPIRARALREGGGRRVIGQEADRRAASLSDGDRRRQRERSPQEQADPRKRRDDPPERRSGPEQAETAHAATVTRPPTPRSRTPRAERAHVEWPCSDSASPYWDVDGRPRRCPSSRSRASATHDLHDGGRDGIRAGGTSSLLAAARTPVTRRPLTAACTTTANPTGACVAWTSRCRLV